MVKQTNHKKKFFKKNRRERINKDKFINAERTSEDSSVKNQYMSVETFGPGQGDPDHHLNLENGYDTLSRNQDKDSRGKKDWVHGSGSTQQSTGVKNQLQNQIGKDDEEGEDRRDSGELSPEPFEGSQDGSSQDSDNDDEELLLSPELQDKIKRATLTATQAINESTQTDPNQSQDQSVQTSNEDSKGEE